MRPNDLVLKCYATNRGEYWEAFCLDFSLAAQADTFEEVKTKLGDMILEYVHDALVGEDRDFSAQLLNRRAPIVEWAKYYLMWAKIRFLHLSSKLQCIFNETIPLKPVSL